MTIDIGAAGHDSSPRLRRDCGPFLSADTQPIEPVPPASFLSWIQSNRRRSCRNRPRTVLPPLQQT